MMKKLYLFVVICLISTIPLAAEEVFLSKQEYFSLISNYLKSVHNYNDTQIESVLKGFSKYEADVYTYDIVLELDMNDDGIKEVVIFKPFTSYSGCIGIIKQTGNKNKLIYKVLKKS
jgi:hypothetical protein